MSSDSYSKKRCPMCQETLPGSAFFKSKVNGLGTYCKTCSAARKRKGELTREEMRRSVYPQEGRKICSKCKAEKPIDEFNVRVRNGKPSVKAQCKSCTSVAYKAWAERTGKQVYASREQRSAAEKEITYPEPDVKLCRSCGRLLSAELFGSRFLKGGNCKECRSADSKEKYKNNRQHHRAYAKKYREENLDHVRAMARRGAAVRADHYKKARAHGRLSTDDKLRLVARYGYRCMCCGAEENITIDHIVPISLGGLDVIENAQLLCSPCNSSKHQQVIDYRPQA